MKIEGEFTFQGARERVWELLQDPEVLAQTLPGTEKLEKTGEDQYESAMRVQVGPVNGVFSCKVTLKDKQPPERYTMLVDSKGAQGFANGAAQVELAAQSANSTLMKYQAELQVGGRLAGVGQRLLDTVGRSMTRQALEALNQALQARIAGDSAAAQTYTAPTQAEFARAVAKDVLRESFRSRPAVWIGAGAVIIIFLAWIILSTIN